jgi:ABC-2 type transport system permease protein
VNAYLRAVAAAFYVSMRMRFVTGFAYLSFLFFPVIVAAVGLFVLEHPGTSAAQWTYGVLGGGLVGYWGVTYIDAGNGIQMERWNGTLEQVFAAPTPLWVIVLGKALGGLLWGMLSFIPTIALGYVGFDALIPNVDAGRFMASFAVLTFSFLAVALSLSPLFAMWRWAFTMINGFEFGTYVFCGLMFPIAVLPGWGQVVASVLAPSWAVRALYASTTSEGAHDYAAWWGLAIGLSLAYLAGSWFLYRLVDRRARVTGQLALV